MNIRTIFAQRKDVYPIIGHKRLLAFNRYGILSKRQLSSACLLSLSRWSTTHGRLSLESTLFSHKSCFTKNICRKCPNHLKASTCKKNTCRNCPNHLKVLTCEKNICRNCPNHL